MNGDGVPTGWQPQTLTEWRDVLHNAAKVQPNDPLYRRAQQAVNQALTAIGQMEGTVVGPDRKLHGTVDLKDVDPGPIASFGLGAADMMSFGLGDQVARAIEPEAELTQQAAGQLHGTAHGLGEIAGALTQFGAPRALGALGAKLTPTAIEMAVRSIKSLPARALARTGLNAAEGAGYVGAQGAGHTEGNLGERAKAGAALAPYGAAGGVLLPWILGGIGAAATKPLQAVMRRVAGPGVEEAAPALARGVTGTERVAGPRAVLTEPEVPPPLSNDVRQAYRDFNAGKISREDLETALAVDAGRLPSAPATGTFEESVIVGEPTRAPTSETAQPISAGPPGGAQHGLEAASPAPPAADPALPRQYAGMAAERTPGGTVGNLQNPRGKAAFKLGQEAGARAGLPIGTADNTNYAQLHARHGVAMAEQYRRGLPPPVSAEAFKAQLHARPKTLPSYARGGAAEQATSPGPTQSVRKPFGWRAAEERAAKLKPGSTLEQALPGARLSVRQTTYRGQPGFSVTGTDAQGHSGISIFVRHEATARQIVEMMKTGNHTAVDALIRQETP